MRQIIENRDMLEPYRKRALERSVMYDVSAVLNDALISDLGMDKPVR